MAEWSGELMAKPSGESTKQRLAICAINWRNSGFDESMNYYWLAIRKAGGA